uniref:Uncharacterized protein n=1 Tax=Panagrolaimus superbus TaxID=310955 RepID=A0A914YFC2_9BILA
MQLRKAMMGAMFQSRQSMMEPRMQQIMQRIRQIHQNENISFSQERSQIKQVIASAPPEVRAKFQEMRERFRNGGGGAGAGMMMMGRGGGGGGFGGMMGNGGGMFGGGAQGFWTFWKRFSRSIWRI